MKGSWRSVKFVAFIFSGGAVASLLLLIIISICVRDITGHRRMIDELILFARILGGVCGGLMMYWSEARLLALTRPR